jgi:holin-like protein
MIAGLVVLLLFQGVGELVSRFAIPFIPGPVIGLVLLLAWLQLRRGVPEPVDLVASTLVKHLGLLFIPAAVGVVIYWPQIRSHALAVGVALLVSVVMTIAVTALVLKLVAGDE